MKPARRPLLTVVILLAAAILAFLLVRFFLRVEETPAVLLPPPADMENISDGGTSASPLTLAEVTPDTVLDVLAALDRASSYTRRLTVETFWENGSGTENINVWVRGESLRLTSGTRNLLLSDGNVWLWYSDGSGILHSSSDMHALADRYSRMLTYEALLEDRPKIDDAYYTDLDGEPCIYLEYADGAFKYVNRLYVSVVSGLLQSAETYDGEKCIYRMSSGPVDISTPEDAVFLPPEGSYAG